ncbi:MAG: hypothetical protein KJ000_33815, partial [Pirellulaceae bacterium]|nr:hypothetical protein [Pirellulaceae bacterium]
ALTVTADAQNKIYGTADPALTYQITAGALVTGDSLTGDLVRQAGENVGAYAIQQGTLTAGANYSLTYVDANLSIAAKTLTATAAAMDKIYDASVAAQVTIHLNGVIGDDAVDGSASGVFDSKDVGTAKTVTVGTVTLSGIDAGNYSVGSAGETTANITPASLTVTANAASKAWGTPDPALTFVTDGLVGGETAAAALTGTLTRQSGESVGDYAILQETLTAINGNYAITFHGAVFRITAVAPNVSIMAVDAAKVEGDSGLTSFTFAITRTGDTSGASTVDWAVAGSGANRVDADDFGGTLPAGTVTFAAGETSHIVTVNVSGDAAIEPDETFAVTLSDPDGATVTTATAAGTVLNDDYPTVSETAWRFDFNSGGSPTQGVAGTGAVAGDTPYVGVVSSDLWNSAEGFGWVSSPGSLDRGGLVGSVYGDLLRDGAWGSGPRDFRMRVEPDMTYDVTVTFGDASFARDRMNVSVVTGDGAGLSNVATGAGQFVHASFSATPNPQGDLVLQFSDSGGDPYWTVTSVEVRQTVTALGVSRSGGGAAQPADGATTDTFEVTGATADAWYTLSTDMGQVTTADGDPRYAGVQIQAPATSFSFTVRRGSAMGTANVRVEEVNGASRGSAKQSYVYAALRQFDFNGSSVDTETDGGTWWSVRGGDVYDPVVGHGWNAAVGEFERSVAGISQPQLDSLYRDGHWQSATRTFQVKVDPGITYDVRIHTGDRSFGRNQLQVTVEDAVQPLVATAANEFKTITVLSVTPSGDGILDIQIANLGGDPYWVLNGIEVAESGLLPAPPPVPVDPPVALPFPLRFDFGTSSSPVDPAFTQVGATNAYAPVPGYGWTTTSSTFSRSGPTDLLRDGHWGVDNTFLVNVPNGNYVVNVTLGDASFARNNLSIWGEGTLQHSGLAPAAGQFIHRSFPVTVADGQLNVQVASTGGDPYFTINALEVLDAPQGNHGLTTNNGGLTFTGSSSAPNGALVTVTTSLGTITSADADLNYAGVQVAVSSGGFSFTVSPPAGGGTATVTSEEVTGLAKGSTTQLYSVIAPAVRRFDFNGTGNDTQTALAPSNVAFQGVRGNQLYSDQNGYGWTQAVSEFQRASAAKSSVALYRDGHWGSAVRTFQVSADDTKTYSIRVYVGDASFARDRIQASVNGGTWVNMTPLSIGANVFATINVSGVSAVGGKLSISIRDAGGDPYWVVNGIDVWESTATDPGEATLLAATWSSEMVGGELTQAAVDAVLPAAREYWMSSGLADWQVAELYRTPVSIGDLSYRGALGVAKPEGIWLDASGAGLGWSVGSSQWSVVNGSQTTTAYDVLTVLTHELGHVLGYDDLDPDHHSDHIMTGVLKPGAGRMEIAAGGRGPLWVADAERDSELANLLGPAAGGRGPLWVAGAERDSESGTLLGPATGGRGPLWVDRAIDELLRDDLRPVVDDDDDEDEEELLLGRALPAGGTDEVDALFAQFATQ